MKILTLNKFVEEAIMMFPYSQCEHVEGLPIETIKRLNPEIAIHLATLTTAENVFDLIKPLIDTNITYGTELLSALSECTDLKIFINTGSFSKYSEGVEKIHDAYLYSATKSAFRVCICTVCFLYLISWPQIDIMYEGFGKILRRSI